MENLSQLLILGNGFDLHCGLKSGYKDFFRSTILDTYSEHNGFPAMKQDCEGFWENLLFRYYIKYRRTEYKWCDIETIIKDTLCSVFFGEYDGSSRNIDHGVWKSALSSAKLGRDPLDEGKKIDDTIRKFLFQYCMVFFYNRFVQRDKYSEKDYCNLLSEQLLQELHNFEKRFCKYIKDNIVNPDNEKELNTKYILNAVNLLAKLTGFLSADYKDIDDIIDKDLDEHFEYEQTPTSSIDLVIKDRKRLANDFDNLKSTNILNFNYTALFDILGVESPCAYSNVHGKLCNGKCSAECSNSSVIFGIDDALIQSQYTNSNLRLFSKTYRKMQDAGAPINILPPNFDPLEIKFYGHSLSEADYSYFQSIFDYYDLYGNSNVSLIFYYSKGFEQNDEIYRLINSYGRTLMNKEQGKNLIHKLLLENRLKIVEIY